MNNIKTWSPLVSVIMPTFNQGPFIKDAIESVLIQSYKFIELIVVDNFSTDDTENIIKSLDDDRIIYLKYNNQGVIAAGRNYAVKHSNGEILAFLDSDDIWFPNKLEVQIPHLYENKVVAVSTNFVPIGNTKACYHHIRHIPVNGMKDYSYIELVHGNPVMTSSLIISKINFEATKGFDESQEFRYIEDWELWLRVALNGNIRVLGLPLIRYRISDKKDRDFREVSKNTLNIINRQIELAKLSKKMIKSAKGNCLINMGRAHLVKRDYSGVKFYIKGIWYSTSPLNFTRALVGLFLYVLPKSLSSKFDKFFHSLASFKR